MKADLKKIGLLSLLLCFLLSFQVFAETSYQDIAKEVRQDIYVYDQCEFVDDSAEEQINSWIKEVKDKTTAEIFVVTVEDLDGSLLERYGYDLFNAIEIGSKEEDNGLLLLIAGKDQKARIVIGRGLEADISAAKSGRILDQFFVPYREEGNLSEGVFYTTQALISEISEKYDVEFSEQENFVKEESDNGFYLLIAIIVIICILLDCSFNRGRITIFVLEVLSESGGSSHHSSGSGRSGGGRTRGSGASR